MSEKSKGNTYELEAKAILEADGFVVERSSAKIAWIPGKFGQRRPISMAHDFFGAWDLIGKKPGHKTMWVQVSTWHHISDKRKQIADFPWTPEHDNCMIFARVRGGSGERAHFRILKAEDGYEWKGHTVLVLKKEKS